MTPPATSPTVTTRAWPHPWRWRSAWMKQTRKKPRLQAQQHRRPSATDIDRRPPQLADNGLVKTALTFLKQLSTLQVALAVSVAVHAALLTVRFVNPEGFNRVFQDTPLEVILVNARSDERPEKATAIAQASLAGGGDVERGRA